MKFITFPKNCKAVAPYQNKMHFRIRNSLPRSPTSSYTHPSMMQDSTIIPNVSSLLMFLLWSESEQIIHSTKIFDLSPDKAGKPMTCANWNRFIGCGPCRLIWSCIAHWCTAGTLKWNRIQPIQNRVGPGTHCLHAWPCSEAAYSPVRACKANACNVLWKDHQMYKWIKPLDFHFMHSGLGWPARHFRARNKACKFPRSVQKFPGSRRKKNSYKRHVLHSQKDLETIGNERSRHGKKGAWVKGKGGDETKGLIFFHKNKFIIF